MAISGLVTVSVGGTAPSSRFPRHVAVGAKQLQPRLTILGPCRYTKDGKSSRAGA